MACLFGVQQNLGIFGGDFWSFGKEGVLKCVLGEAIWEEKLCQYKQDRKSGGS